MVDESPRSPTDFQKKFGHSASSFQLAPGSVYGLRTFTTALWEEKRVVLMGNVMPWLNNVQEAQCVRDWSLRDDYTVEVDSREHKAPDPDCVCGIYAYWSRESIEETYASITAVIEATGRTIIGTKGFRTERARIIALSATKNESAWSCRVPKCDVCREAKRGAQSFSTRFGIPVYTTVTEMLATHPLTTDYASLFEDPTETFLSKFNYRPQV